MYSSRRHGDEDGFVASTESHPSFNAYICAVSWSLLQSACHAFLRPLDRPWRLFSSFTPSPIGSHKLCVFQIVTSCSASSLAISQARPFPRAPDERPLHLSSHSPVLRSLGEQQLIGSSSRRHGFNELRCAFLAHKSDFRHSLALVCWFAIRLDVRQGQSFRRRGP